MMSFRWSWIFILYSLLVGPSGAAMPDDSYTKKGIHPRAPRLLDLLTGSTDTNSPKKVNTWAIVGGCLGGFLVLALLAFILFKRRQRIRDVEEGPRSPNAKKKPDDWVPDLKSQFSPDDKQTGKFDRLREALGKRPGISKKAPLDNIFPVYLPPRSSETIDRPPPSVPTHVPRYPSILERGSKRRPSPLEGYPDPSRVSIADTIQSTDSEMSARRQLQVPPKALVVPTPGRPLPGLAIASAKSAGLNMPKSPSRRRSLFSKQPFKHPFIPVRNVDSTLKFPPGSPLFPAQYQPSRQHLEARMEARSPRIEASPRSARPGRDSASVRRKLPPSDEPGSSKQARLVEALHSAGIAAPRSPRTPIPNGSRTALPPHSSKHPLRSAKFLPDPPTTSYI